MIFFLVKYISLFFKLPNVTGEALAHFFGEREDSETKVNDNLDSETIARFAPNTDVIDSGSDQNQKKIINLYSAAMDYYKRYTRRNKEVENMGTKKKFELVERFLNGYGER